ncbi:MAG: multiprotein-bridging factor 1 family protein [Halodesulfurarchaeum sp.]
MPKYSTGGATENNDGGACELCGTTAESLQTVTVEGATLSVCSECASLGEEQSGSGGGGGGDTGGTRDGTGENRRKRAARNVAKTIDAAGGDSTHWEEHGTNYDRDQLPYLVPDYGEKVKTARQEAGFQREELASSLGISENDLLAIEQERAIEASVGGSVIRSIESHLDLDLVDE